MPFKHDEDSGYHADQRAQFRSAIISLVGERGFANLSLAVLLERAALPEEAFKHHYADLQDCFHQVFIEVGEEFLQRAGAAFASQGVWREQLRSVAYAMLEWLQEDPDRARFMLVEALAAGEATQATRDQFLSWLFLLIDLGRQELPEPESLSPATAAAIGGTVFNRIRQEIEADNFEELHQLAPKLIYSAVLPYVGAQDAAKELTMRPPRAR